MNQNLQTLLTNLLLGAFVIALLSYADWESWFESDSIAESEEAQPDLIAFAVEQIQFNKKGEKHFLLKAEQIQQFLDNDRNLIIEPDLLLYREQQPAWKTTAREGSSDAQGDNIHLRGGVQIQQQGRDNGAILETDTLTLSATTSHAFTDDKVVVRQTGILIEAEGLEADLNENKITLKSRVTSIYEPAKS
jgi:LPS export ABC transporter protein LptC